MAAYDFKVELPELKDRRVFLRADVGDDMFTLTVNGQDAGACLWNPYVLDVTELLHAGENTLCLQVANTLQNLLIGERRRSGLYAVQLELHDAVR